MTFICQGPFDINSSNISGHQRAVTVSEIHATLFFCVLRKYLIELKLFHSQSY